ncbi:hypothetical protein R2R35_08445 [Anaerocolumna sp. AGMB13020]|nr:hypothetical protein [Anaerocolumna sp. AGMB13020]WOO38519.1 hypothetical protein R2R35_08445 [Anaerocolumna sp. AGMB13020]
MKNIKFIGMMLPGLSDNAPTKGNLQPSTGSIHTNRGLLEGIDDLNQ